MTREEAKTIFLNRGYIEVDGGTYFDGNKWRESVVVISEWLKEEPCTDAINRHTALDAMYALCDTGETLKENPWRDNPHIDAVIETIEQISSVQLQQPCEDAISRQAVLDAIITLWADKPFGNPALTEIKECVERVPSVNPQPKTGHWIQTQEKDDAEPCILWECSECHKEFRSVVHKVSNYCPNCGSHNGDVRKWRDKE